MITIEYRSNQISSDVPAIVLNADGNDYIIDPFLLNNCLVEKGVGDDFLSFESKESNGVFYFNSLYSHVEINRGTLILSLISLKQSFVDKCKTKDFIGMFVDSLKLWLDDVKNNVKTVYRRSNNDSYKNRILSNIMAVIENCQLVSLINNYNDISDFFIDNFQVHIQLGEVEDHANNMDSSFNYKIEEGNRVSHGCITGSLCQPEQIRQYLEIMVNSFPNDMELFHFDDDEASFIKMERIDEDCNLFIVRVINPDCSEPYNIFVCYIQSFLKPFYEGLLHSSLQVEVESFDFDDLGVAKGKRCFNYYPRTVLYNKLKSPIIEEFLYGDSICSIWKENEPFIRQRLIKNIYIIQSDNGHIIIDHIGSTPLFISENNVLNLSDRETNSHICTLSVPGLYEWKCELENKTNGMKNNVLDVDKWFKQGLELAHYICDKMPNDCELWYDPLRCIEYQHRSRVLLYKNKLEEH